MNITKSFCLGAVGTIILAISLVFIIPKYKNYHAQMAIDSWKSDIKQIQQRIETQIKSKNLDFNAIKFPKLSHIYAAYINADGTVIIKGNAEANGALLISIPQLNKGNVQWRHVHNEK